MKKFLFLLCSLLFSVVGAWATTPGTLSSTKQITAADQFADGKLYAVRVNGGSYITESEGQYVAPNTQNSITDEALYSIVPNADGETFTVRNYATHNYWGELTGSAVGTFAPSAEAVDWTFTFNGSNVQASSGGFYINRSSGVMHGWTTGINLQIYEVNNIEVNFVTALDDLSNNKCYVVYNQRAAWNVADEATSANAIALDVDAVSERFALINYNDAYYIYSVNAKAFLTKDNTLGDPEAVTIVDSGVEGYPFFFKFDDSHNINVSGGRVIIDSWTTVDAGNANAIIEAADFDPFEAIAKIDPSTAEAKNLDFSESTPVGVGIHTYAKDIQGSNLAQMQPVEGWTMGVENGDARAAGVFAYGDGNFVGGDGYIVPATNPEGNVEGNALGLVGVWSATVQYVQKVILEPANYVLTIPVYNSKGGTNVPVKSLIGFIADNGTEYLAPAKAYPVDTWTNEVVTFSLSEQTTGYLTLGYQGQNVGSGSAQHLFIDGIKIETATNAEVVRAELVAALAEPTAAVEAKAGVGEALFQKPVAAYDTFASAVAAAQAVADNTEATAEDLEAAKADLEAAVEAYAAAINAPEEDATYTFQQKSSGLYLALDAANDKVMISETAQAFTFEAGEGGYYLINEEGAVGFAGTNNWTMSANAEKKMLISPAPVEIDGVVYYTLNEAKGMIASDNETEGSACYTDKSIAKSGDKAYWTIAKAEAPVEPEEYTGLQLTFDRTGTGVADVAVKVADQDGNALETVTATLVASSITSFRNAGAEALTRTENSVLAPASGAGYSNTQGDQITYTFRIDNLNADFAFNTAVVDVYALNGGGTAQNSDGTCIREWTIGVETGAAEDALAAFVEQAGNDICTVEDEDGGLHHKAWEIAAAEAQTATAPLFVKVTLTKTAELGCFAGIGALQLTTAEKEEGPEDVTALIQNPAYLENGYEGWTYTENAFKARSYEAPMNLITYSGNAAFEVSQVLKDVPAGLYKLTVNAFYRAGSLEDEQAKVAAGTELEKELTMYATTAAADTYSKKVMNLSEGAADAQVEGTGVEFSEGKYVPNSAADSRTWYIAGEYTNEVLFNVFEQGDVTIGLSKTEGLVSDYCPIGAWKLFRLGDADAEAATPDEKPVEPVVIETGKYYLRNVASGKYWGAANDWGTRASMIEHPDFVTLVALEDGTYHLESQVSNGGTNYYFGGDYMDGQPVALTLTQVGEYFTIDNAGNFFGYDGSSTVLGKNLAADSENALWQIISEADMFASLATATEKNPVDATFLITDHTFGRNHRNVNAWTNEGGAALTGGNSNKHDAEKYHGVFNVYQKLAQAPAGIYKFTAQGFYRQDGTDNDNLPVFYANEETATFPLKTGSENSMADACTSFEAGLYQADPIFVEVTEAGELTVGAKLEVNTTLWVIWDNFVLEYYGTEANIDNVKFAALLAEVDELRAKAEELKADENVSEVAATALETALTETAEVEKTDEALKAAIETLTEAVEKGEVSIDIAKKIAAAERLVASTNVYTAEAKEAYEAVIAEAKQKNTEGTITRAEAAAFLNPEAIQAWHAANTYDDFLLSAWTINDVQCADYTTSLYINTWSIEGETDGTEFKVPFFEYWTGDANSLGENKLTATMSGLEAGLYEVSVWARVRAKNGYTAPAYGITLDVNGGEATDVAAGEQVGESQFFLAEFKAVGTVGEDGVLKINFNVAADNNISWLSFKNVNFAPKDETEYAYEQALATLKDGYTYRIFVEQDGAKYYLKADGYLTASEDEAEILKFSKVKGEAYEYGFKMVGVCYTNPETGGNTTFENDGHIHTNIGQNRDNWEGQVFFLKDGKYAVRATNATNVAWGANTYWDVFEGAELPEAGYSLEPNYIWQVETYVDLTPLNDIVAELEAVIAATDTYADEVGAAAAATSVLEAVKAAEYGSIEEVNAAVAEVLAAAKTFLTAITVKKDIDVTNFFIVNATPTSNIDGWEGQKSNAFDAGNNVAEFWSMSGANFHQTINLPEGAYRLIVTALTRTGMTSTVYAGDNSVEIATVDKSVVNNRTQANAWFNEGNGLNVIDFEMAEAGDIEIGLTADNTTSDYWTVWRSFRLILPGEPASTAVTVTYDGAEIAFDETGNAALDGAYDETLLAVVGEDENAVIETSYAEVDGNNVLTITVKGADAETNPNNTKTYTINFSTAVGLNAISADLENAVIYDLAGRRVSKAVKGGIYIINGKKVAIK